MERNEAEAKAQAVKVAEIIRIAAVAPALAPLTQDQTMVRSWIKVSIMHRWLRLA